MQPIRHRRTLPMPSKTIAEQKTHELAFRQSSFRQSSEADKAAGSIPVVLATESPVRVYDKVRRKVVNEILLMSGAELPRQIPMQDDHEDKTAGVIGSIRGFAIVGD